MKQHILDFVRRGMVAMGIGPLVLAVLYWVFQRQGLLQTLTVRQVCTGILSLSALAFVAGGMNSIHQIERLPLMVGILIHGTVLYIAYLVTYLVNGWLEWGTAPVLVFTGIFVVGYLAIWAVIYAVVKRNTTRVNEMLKEKQENCRDDR